MALHTSSDLLAGRAIAADFTAQGWHTHLGLTDTPILSTETAGRRLAELARKYHFSLFEYWMSDYAGHNQEMEAACALLENFDQVLGGLLEAWDDREGLILVHRQEQHEGLAVDGIDFTVDHHGRSVDRDRVTQELQSPRSEREGLAVDGQALPIDHDLHARKDLRALSKIPQSGGGAWPHSGESHLGQNRPERSGDGEGTHPEDHFRSREHLWHKACRDKERTQAVPPEGGGIHLYVQHGGSG